MAKEFKAPVSLAECADQLYSTRETRLALATQITELERQEGILRESLIDRLPKSQATGIAGKLVRVTVVNKTVYKADNWETLRAFITKAQKKSPGVWGLLNKAVNQATVKDMVEAGADFKAMGLSKMDVPVLSMNKV